MSKKLLIIHGATKLFAHKGFNETSISEISKLTGAAEGTIFYHFKNKEELFVSILENVRTKIVQEFERYEQERSFENGMEMLEEVIAFHLYLAGIMEDGFLLLHRHSPYQLAEQNPVCREHLEAIYNCLVDIFERAVTTGQRDGSITSEMPPRKTALVIFTMVDGLIRFKTYNLYDAGALFNTLLASCRRMLQNND